MIRTQTEIDLLAAQARIAELEATADDQAEQLSAAIEQMSRVGRLLRIMAQALQTARMRRTANRDFWREDADYSARNS